MADTNISSVADTALHGKDPAKVSVINGWLICIIIVLGLTVGWLLYGILDKNSIDIFNWVLFTLLAATLSCGINAFISHLSQKAEESKEKQMMDVIDALFVMNTSEIKDLIDGKTNEIIRATKFSLERSDLAYANQKTILNMLLDLSLDIDRIEKIRILAHTSDSFSKFFIEYFENNEKELKCTELSILIHDQDVNEKSDVVKDWCSFCKKNSIKLEIRKAKIKRRSFFGIIIEFERDSHHRIGMIGFYKPQDEVVLPYKRYGVFSEDNSILDVLDEYFKHYFNENYSTLIPVENEKEPI